MSLTNLYFIRHGITASNAQRIYMGRSQECLSTEGRWQAREVSRRLQSEALDAIYCSPLRRAIETAEIIAQPHRLELRTDADLMELDLSRWQGRPASEIAAADPDAWHTWCTDPARLAIPGVESFDALGERVRRFLGRIQQSYPSGTVAVVTHDGVIRMAVMEALGISWSHYRSLPLDNTSITTVELGGPHPRLRRFNDIGHLTGVGVSGPADD